MPFVHLLFCKCLSHKKGILYQISYYHFMWQYITANVLTARYAFNKFSILHMKTLEVSCTFSLIEFNRAKNIEPLQYLESLLLTTI